GERLLAQPSTKPPMDSRLLGPGKRWLPVDRGLLGGGRAAGGGVPPAAARAAGSGRRGRTAAYRIYLGARQLGMEWWPLFVAARILGGAAPALVLDTGDV